MFIRLSVCRHFAAVGRHFTVTADRRQRRNAGDFRLWSRCRGWNNMASALYKKTRHGTFTPVEGYDVYLLEQVSSGVSQRLFWCVYMLRRSCFVSANVLYVTYRVVTDRRVCGRCYMTSPGWVFVQLWRVCGGHVMLYVGGCVSSRLTDKVLFKESLKHLCVQIACMCTNGDVVARRRSLRRRRSPAGAWLDSRLLVWVRTPCLLLVRSVHHVLGTLLKVSTYSYQLVTLSQK